MSVSRQCFVFPPIGIEHRFVSSLIHDIPDAGLAGHSYRRTPPSLAPFPTHRPLASLRRLTTITKRDGAGGRRSFLNPISHKRPDNYRQTTEGGGRRMEGRRRRRRRSRSNYPAAFWFPHTYYCTRWWFGRARRL